MEKAVRDDGATVDARKLAREYGMRPPRHIIRHLRCQACGRPVRDAAFTPSSRMEPHFRHRKNDPVAQRCPLYAAGNEENIGSLDSKAPHRSLLFPLYLRMDGGKGHVEMGINGMSQEERDRLYDSSATLRVYGEIYQVSRFAAQSQFKVPIVPFPLQLSRAVRIAINREGPVVPKFFREPRDTLIFNNVFGDQGGRHILPGGKIYIGEEYFLMTQQALSDHDRVCLDAKKRGTVQGELRNFNVFSFRVEDTDDTAALQSAGETLRRFGYELAYRTNDIALLWPPSVSVDYMDSPVFEHTPVYYATSLEPPTPQTDLSKYEAFRQYPYSDDDRKITVSIGPGDEASIECHRWDGSMLAVLFSDAEEWVALLPDYDDIDHLQLAESVDAPALGAVQDVGERPHERLALNPGALVHEIHIPRGLAVAQERTENDIHVPHIGSRSLRIARFRDISLYK